MSKRKPRQSYQPEDLRPHHAKPYRKRHYILLVSSTIMLAALAYALISNSASEHAAIRSARDLISRVFNQGSPAGRESDNGLISSSYGFSIKYNPAILQASALNAKDGSLYGGSDLAISRPYANIKIVPVSSGLPEEATPQSLIIQYYQDKNIGSSVNLVRLEAQLIGFSNQNFKISSSSKTTISEIVFIRSEWLPKDGSGSHLGSALKPGLVSYTGVVNGRPLTITINQGVVKDLDLEGYFQSVVESLNFQPASASKISPKQESSTVAGSQLSLLDRLMLTKPTSAQALLNKDNPSERISLLYSPSVVRIYNSYCMDILLGGSPFIANACSTSTGSGFFVGDKGYIATNGHVVVNDPLSIAIAYSFEQASKGDMSYFTELARSSGLTQQDIDSAPTNKEKVKVAVDKFYTNLASKITAPNKIENLVVGLGLRQPNIEELLAATKSHKSYQSAEGLKKATITAFNYRAIDGLETGAFKASDVALIKIEDGNYPSTKLGSISSLMQGSGLSIIGYPGAASSNPLVETSESRPTLTSGKVSSIKSAAGSSNQLIETDATIGHGNSGGPVFNDAGEVVGIATYTIDSSKEGDGVFNYARDITDLKSLASRSNIYISSEGRTQQEWGSAIKDLYKARYSDAIKKLEIVKGLYPEHPRVDQLMAMAKQKIVNGEEAKQFSTPLIALASLIGVLLLISSILLIVEHSRKHAAYKEQISEGNIKTLLG